MKKNKELKNLKIFAPKRKFVAPRYAEVIRPNETKTFSNDHHVSTITNVSLKPIYVRYE